MALQNKDVRTEVSALLATGTISQAQIAAECGISTTAVSQFLGEKYTGDNEKVAANLSAFLNRYKSAAQNPNNQLPFVKTSISRAVFEVADTCHTAGVMGMVVGASGLGKTRSIEQYIFLNPGTILISAHAKYSVKDVFSDIHRAIGFDGEGNVHRMMRDISNKLKGTNRLIIIDEAEHLSAICLDEIRQINDRARIGVLYVGLEKFRSQVRAMKSGYEYIVNRVKIPRKLGKLMPEDTEMIVKSILPSANGLCKVFHEMSGGNARVLETILFNSLRVAKINKCEIDPRLIKQVAIEVIV